MPNKEKLIPDTSVFWNAKAPHLFSIEDNYFNLDVLKSIIKIINGQVLVAGAGQGLIVEELHKNNLVSDRVDYSPEMIRFAACDARRYVNGEIGYEARSSRKI
jgi:2-polyprenyl-3-methyl-5-hydroxy-6-metoxy-1,4-benzoquinol methylase